MDTDLYEIYKNNDVPAWRAYMVGQGREETLPPADLTLVTLILFLRDKIRCADLPVEMRIAAREEIAKYTSDIRELTTPITNIEQCLYYKWHYMPGVAPEKMLSGGYVVVLLLYQTTNSLIREWAKFIKGPPAKKPTARVKLSSFALYDNGQTVRFLLHSGADDLSEYYGYGVAYRVF